MRDLRSIELASLSPWQSALHHIRQQKSRAGFWRFSGSSFGYRWLIEYCCCSPGKPLLPQWRVPVEQLGTGIVSWMWFSLLTKCAKCGCSPSGRLYSVVWKQMVNQGKVSASKVGLWLIADSHHYFDEGCYCSFGVPWRWRIANVDAAIWRSFPFHSSSVPLRELSYWQQIDGCRRQRQTQSKRGKWSKYRKPATHP